VNGKKQVMVQDTNVLVTLQEIPLPEPVSYVPQTGGWVIVGAIVLIAIGYGLWRLHRRREANFYRRTALAQLCEVEGHLTDPATRLDALAAIPILVKRTALSAMPREKIASLSESAWLACLDRTYLAGGFSNGPGRLLTRLAYAGPSDLAALPDTEVQEFLRLVRRWIERHDARL